VPTNKINSLQEKPGISAGCVGTVWEHTFLTAPQPVAVCG
jgi:hypothetical protein